MVFEIKSCKPKKSGFTRALLLIATVGLSAFSCKSFNPPNALTAMLAAVPQIGSQGIDGFYFTDFRQARSDLHIARDAGLEAFPSPLQDALRRLSPTIVGEGTLYSIDQLEAVLEITPTGSPGAVMLVGSFDSKKAVSVLDSSGWPVAESGLFRLYRAPDASGIGIGPRRLVYSPDYRIAEAITAFRGGESSILKWAGLERLALSAGLPTAMAAAPVEQACLDARWISVAIRYLDASLPAASVVLLFSDPDSAVVAKRKIESRLELALDGGGSKIELIDIRRDMVVSVVSVDDSRALFLLGKAKRNSTLKRALEC